MSKMMKTWLIIAAALVVLGIAIFAVSMTSTGWDFTKLNTGNYETNDYDITEEFADISIKTDVSDIAFLPSDDGKCKVSCCEKENMKHSVSVSGNVLTIDMVDIRKWYDYIGINIGSPKITIYLPESEYSSLIINESVGDINIAKDFKFKSIDISVTTGDVVCYASATEDIKMTASTGDICVDKVSADSLTVSVTTGAVTVSDSDIAGDTAITVTTGRTVLSDVACKNVISGGSTGDITLKNVIAAEEISIERSTGDVIFECSDADTIFVKTSTGDVEGTLLSDKVFITQTSVGDVEVPKSITGGRCEIITSTGDISIEIKE